MPTENLNLVYIQVVEHVVSYVCAKHYFQVNEVGY